MQRASREEFSGEILYRRRIANFNLFAVSYHPNQVLSRHSHEHGYVSVALRGGYLEEIAAGSWECTAGGTIFHAPGESHQNRFHDKGAHLLVLEFESQFLNQLACQGIEINRQYALTSAYCMQLGARLERTLELSDPLSALSAEGLSLELLSEALRPCSAKPERRRADWLPRVQEILHDRYREHLTLTDIAVQVQVHPVHLARAFRKRYTCCIGDFIRKLRVEAACSELIQSDAPIAEIAARTGFTDQSHLSRVMKRHAGISPAELRRAARRSEPSACSQ
jgi:AraC family transcriptional regulator